MNFRPLKQIWTSNTQLPWGCQQRLSLKAKEHSTALCCHSDSELYECAGFRECTCIDMNGYMHVQINAHKNAQQWPNSALADAWWSCLLSVLHYLFAQSLSALVDGRVEDADFLFPLVVVLLSVADPGLGSLNCHLLFGLLLHLDLIHSKTPDWDLEEALHPARLLWCMLSLIPAETQQLKGRVCRSFRNRS